MSKPKGTTFSELPAAEARALLERNHIGRLAFSFHDRVDIEPISYVYRDGWLYARTSHGTKLTAVQHHPWVAFEADEVESRTDWRSVVARGTIYFLDAERGAAEREAYETGLELLRSAEAGVLTAADVAPHRRALFRIHIDEITGRQAFTA